MTMATAVPMKGSSGRFVVDKVVEFLDECGCSRGDIVIKSDQEQAIKILVQDVVEARGDSRTLVEESPVKNSGSTGVVERTIQPEEGLIRTLKSGLEERLGFRVDAEQAVVAFMAEYAAYLQNRLFVGKDGKTAYERVKGKTAKVLRVEFGEKLMWKV